MAADSPEHTSPLRLLLVCNANQCRSPMAAAMAGSILGSWTIPAQVASGGILEGGMPAVRRAIAEMGRRGLDLSQHRSRQLDPDLVGAADLILTMERRQLVTIAGLDMEAIERAFTLREFDQLAPMVGRRRPDQSVASWVASAHRSRLPSTILVYATGDDIADPTGGSKRAFRATADQIHDLLERDLGYVVGIH